MGVSVCVCSGKQTVCVYDGGEQTVCICDGGEQMVCVNMRKGG